MAPASAADAAPSVNTIEHIALGRLKPSPNNMRRVSDDDQIIKDLAQSLASPLGQLQPILVRPLGDEGFEIMDGECRFRAARVAGLKTLECKIVDCDDAAANEITAIANLQRNDLKPLEQVRAIAILLKSGRDIAAIAERCGRPVAWVRLRAKVAEMTPKWMAALADEKNDVARLSISHLELIARMDPEVQDELLAKAGNVFDLEYNNDPIEVKHLRDFLDREYLRQLASAPWRLDDEQLVPAAGACSACPKRSSCEGALFADLGAGSKKDRCLDVTCWNQKSVAFVAARKVQLAEKHGEDLVVVVSHGDKGKRDDQSVSSSSVQECAKTDKQARPALIASPDAHMGKPGELKWVKPTSYGVDSHDAKVLGVKSSSAGGSSGSPPRKKKDPVEQIRRQQLTFVAEKLSQQLSAKDQKQPSPATLVRLVLAFGVGAGDGDFFPETSIINSVRMWKALEKDWTKPQTLTTEWKELWGRVIEVLDQRIGQINLKSGHSFADMEAELEHVADVLGVNFFALLNSAKSAHPTEPPRLEGKTAAKAAAKPKAKKGKK